MKRIVASLFMLVSVSSALAAEQILALGHSWTVEQQSDWSLGDGVLRLLKKAEPPAGQPRRPTKFALVDSKPFGKVTVEAEVKRNGKSVILVYGWQDKDHYNYAHLSSDEASRVRVHNGIFHVSGGDRARISVLDGPASLPTQDWTPVKLVFDGESGACYVEVNGQRIPSLEAVDLELRWGRVGFGSFNETGDIRGLKISGEMLDVAPDR